MTQNFYVNLDYFHRFFLSIDLTNHDADGIRLESGSISIKCLHIIAFFLGVIYTPNRACSAKQKRDYRQCLVAVTNKLNKIKKFKSNQLTVGRDVPAPLYLYNNSESLQIAKVK